MVSLGFAPKWFFQYGIALELIFAIITLFVAIYSFKIYDISKERYIRLFGIAFLLFSISYFIQSVLNIGILFELSQNVPIFVNASKLFNLGLTALYFHMILAISALVILSTLCFRAKSRKILFLLLAVSVIPIFLSVDPLRTFFILSTIYLAFISYNYFTKCTPRNKKIMLVAIAFLLLLLSNILFILSPSDKIYYVIAHIFILAAFILILINLILVSNK